MKKFPLHWIQIPHFQLLLMNLILWISEALPFSFQFYFTLVLSYDSVTWAGDWLSYDPFKLCGSLLCPFLASTATYLVWTSHTHWKQSQKVLNPPQNSHPFCRWQSLPMIKGKCIPWIIEAFEGREMLVKVKIIWVSHNKKLNK